MNDNGGKLAGRSSLPRLKVNVLSFMTRRTFTLNARADRIDQNADGKLSIIDYKTGRTSSDKQISAGFSPQLPLKQLSQ